MYYPSNGSPRTANTWGYIAVHEKQEANRAATASHGELPRLPSREGRKKAKSQKGGKNGRRQDTRLPRGRGARHTWRRCAPEGLWSLDVLGIKEPCEKETRIELEEAARDHFAKNVPRDEEGRYVVSLPWIQDHPPLSNCKNLAERRLKNCLRSLERSGNLGNYEAVFHSWLDEDIIEEVQKDADTKNEQYLPHHPVCKDNSTTKIRLVFDGSVKEKNSSSINECLEKGPNIVELIPAIINKFRLRKFGITADIEKAFPQIGIQEDDKRFLRFLWWENGDKENTKIYQHKKVVFGISSSPFLLGATLEHHLKQVTGHMKATEHKLLESFYDGNCVTSVDNQENLGRFMLESREILSPAKFNLRGWEHTGVSAGKKVLYWRKRRKFLFWD
ncbi:hypothetical protein AVEN_178051-1 [Araneus ventricosus]|uniref:Reverse transcriptase domain-containing protein n=1 Tax=Araneus ventricosus TaxID=182803 RepID=A0A4Y2I465_ARAVE|nr:hypothetical protein AVEN_178051-1 [Araneus ventricosus]